MIIKWMTPALSCLIAINHLSMHCIATPILYDSWASDGLEEGGRFHVDRSRTLVDITSEEDSIIDCINRCSEERDNAGDV